MQFNSITIEELQLNHSVEVNPSSGSALASVDIPLPNGRNGFNPNLSLRYASSSRNSAFGMGWLLSGTSFVAIDTKEGLPKYDGSDHYSLNGTSIVPRLILLNSKMVQKTEETTDFWVYHFIAKYESDFTRIERLVHKHNGEVHWRTTTKDNVISIFGLDSTGSTRIFNPERKHEIFMWLLERQYDNLGNCIQYNFVSENDDHIDYSSLYDKNRIKYFIEKGFSQKYLERIVYSNTHSLFPDSPIPVANEWLFEIVFDYGQFPDRPYESSDAPPDGRFNIRKDSFSVYQPGFEIRTWRLCKRLLIYHSFQELSPNPSLTGIFECIYHESPLGSTLERVKYTGVRKDLFSGTYSEKALPEIRFHYTKPELGKSFNGIPQPSLENFPKGFNASQNRFVDLFCEGLPGLLTETAGAWYFKPNLGNGVFGKQETVIEKPTQNLNAYSLGDFDRDGNINLFTLQGNMAGYYEYDRDQEKWSGFTPFDQIPQVSNARFLDIDADGFADMVVEREDKIICYPFKGKAGFGKPFAFAKPISNGTAYAPIIGDLPALDYFMADMTGDGLPDQVQIQNGRVAYYPNLGNGHFGEMVLMKDAPLLDFENSFDAAKIRLYDLDGSGTTDIIYIGNGEIRYWFNASGNAFIEGGRISGLPWIDNISSANVLDFLGNGTPCLIWSSASNHANGDFIQYLELTNGVKPGLLTSMENGMGREILLEYGYTAQHYLRAKLSENPWISKTPGHFTVVDRKKVIDHITAAEFTTEYRYYDGHYDGHERSFVVFGYIEQYDLALYENARETHDNTYSQPMCTKTWLHNGIFGWDRRSTLRYYNKDKKQPLLVAQVFEKDEALEETDFTGGFRSLAGKPLRQEFFAVQENGLVADHPFSVSQYGYCIRRLQAQNEGHDACFFAWQRESLEMVYEQNPEDPRIAHHLSLLVGAYGDIEKGLSIAYSRRQSAPSRTLAQSKDYFTASVSRFLTVDKPGVYHTGILYESREFEINFLPRQADELIKWRDAVAAIDGLVSQALPFDQTLPTFGNPKARLHNWHQTFFWNDAFDAVLPLGQAGERIFAHHEESACFNDAFIAGSFGVKVTNAMLSSANEGNYIRRDGYWWQHSPVLYFGNSSTFYSLMRSERSAGNIVTNTWDDYFLCLVRVTDPMGNISQAEIDYNIVEPFRLTDPNGNISEVLYDPLGIPIVNTWQGTVLDDSGHVQLYGNGRIEAYKNRPTEQFSAVLNDPARYLQQASSFTFYDTDAWKNEGKPLNSITITRENLIHDGDGNTDNAFISQLNLTWQDGLGRIIQSKQKVEPGPAIQRNANGSIVVDNNGQIVSAFTNQRWLVSGHVVYDNKQRPVRQFEPFFSGIPDFESDALLEKFGVASQNYYDATGRAFRTDFPDGSFSEIRFSPWEIAAYDQNDTVGRSLYQTFREMLPAGTPDRVAMEKSLLHQDTPTITQLDPLGRETALIAANNDGTVRKSENRLDAGGQIIDITDARNLKAFEYRHDMLGRVLYEKSMDAGEKWNFFNNLDQIIHYWDSRNSHFRTRYDFLDRVDTVHVQDTQGVNQIVERFIYGENAAITKAAEKNLRGQLVRHFDQAGVQEILRAVPGGTPIAATRKLVEQYTLEPNWDIPQNVILEQDTYTFLYKYDSLERPIAQQLPDGTTRRFIYNQGGGIQKISITTADGVLNNVDILKDAQYDAKGLRLTALLGNNVEIAYTYDTETFRMRRLRSRKTTGNPRIYQDIRYAFDPVGNLTYLIDEAQQPAAPQPRIIQGLNVSTHAAFEYDALYQLKTAEGRVHQALLQRDYADRSREAAVPANWAKGTRHISLNNGAAVERYTQTYAYDEAGNIKTIRQQSPSQNWVNTIWTSASSNRSLPQNDLNGNPVSQPETRFDANGNCIFLPHLRNIVWNYRNNISKVVVIDRSVLGKPNDEEYYIYGGNGMRVRKITQRVTDVANSTIELTEKIYLDGCEIKSITRGGAEILRRFTSKISDGNQQIAILHSWTADTGARETDDISKKKIHYQLPNHLGSASIELDENGDIITYEEYFPFGGTSFIAGRNKRDIDLKEYRYSGKERDDFTGLYYFGYRYYAHWIGGWINPDPLGPEDSENLYLYVHNNPINLVDPNGLQSTEVSLAQQLETFKGLSDRGYISPVGSYVENGTAVEQYEGHGLIPNMDGTVTEYQAHARLYYDSNGTLVNADIGWTLTTNQDYYATRSIEGIQEIHRGRLPALTVLPESPPAPLRRDARHRQQRPGPEAPNSSTDAVDSLEENQETPPPAESVEDPPSEQANQSGFEDEANQMSRMGIEDEQLGICYLPEIPQTQTASPQTGGSDIPVPNPVEDIRIIIVESARPRAGSVTQSARARIGVPRDFTPGETLYGTYNLWSNEPGGGLHDAAAAEGFIMEDTMLEDAAEATARRLGYSGRYDPLLDWNSPSFNQAHFNEIWHPTSDTLATRVGLSQTPASSNGLEPWRNPAHPAPSATVQMSREIPRIFLAGGLMAQMAKMSGVFTIVISTQIDNPYVRYSGYTAGGLEFAGGTSYLLGVSDLGAGYYGPRAATALMRYGSWGMRLGGGGGVIILSAYSGYHHIQQGEYGVAAGDTAGILLGVRVLSGSGPQAAFTGTFMVSNYAGDFVESRVTPSYGRPAGVASGTATGLAIGGAVGYSLAALGLVSNPVGWGILVVGGVGGLIGALW